MTEAQKIALLKSKLGVIYAASLEKDPQAEALFLSLFNACKNSDTLFTALVEDRKTEIAQQVVNIEKQKAALAAEKDQLDTLQTAAVAVDEPVKG